MALRRLKRIRFFLGLIGEILGRSKRGIFLSLKVILIMISLINLKRMKRILGLIMNCLEIIKGIEMFYF